MISYVTGEKHHASSKRYRETGFVLAKSETEGLSSIDIVGDVLSNIPPAPKDYVERPAIEELFKKNVIDDRRLIITLQGRGGIGKTALALHVLSQICYEPNGFERVLWFSARDIDLLPQGAKPVRPKVLDLNDVAELYADLSGFSGKRAERNEKFLTELGSTGEPTIFVFDNFETLLNPVDFYSTIDAHVRQPNRIVITTRHREFRGDYPIEVTGMEHSECVRLIENTAGRLGIGNRLNEKYIGELIQEADGHPYIIKMLLGEAERTNQLGSVRRVIAGSDQVLSALFERTYSQLSPVARKSLPNNIIMAFVGALFLA